MLPKPDLIHPRPDWTARQTATLPRPMTALQIWQQIFARPLPGLGLAMRVRDSIMAPFGVRAITGDAKAAMSPLPQPGDRMGLFTLDTIRPDLLSLVARDRHLDTMTCVTTDGIRVEITSSVKWHNLFGRFYMIPVGPAHRLIVRAMLARMG